jgi:hypothetical protein
MRSSQGNMGFAIVIAVALVLLAYIVLTFNTPPPPIVAIKDYSLNPSTINVNGAATLSFTLKNNDGKNSHFVTVQFNASEMVTFWQGDALLASGNNGFQYFSQTFYPSDLITTYITVKATLPSQMSSSTYPIVLNFFVDSKQFGSKQVNLTVQG